MGGTTVDPVETRTDDRIGLITLNRPESLNAWTMSMQRDVAATVTAMGEASDVDAVVITGAGDRAFCAGQDLAESRAFTEIDTATWLDGFVRCYSAILGCPKPVIAAINGVAAGSGYQLALVCDIRVAHPQVRIGQPEVSSGIPSIAGLYLTWESLGHSRTVELMLSGRLMFADEAERVGLVHRVVAPADVLPTAIEYGRTLAAQPTLAFRLTKQRVYDVLRPGLVESFAAAAETDRMAWAAGEPQKTAERFFRYRKAGNPTAAGR
jgi:enoyl-CoA hydratase/carnithine racemase